MLEAVLDMRQTLSEANKDELIEVFDPLDVIATYTKSTRPPAGRDRHPALVADHEKTTAHKKRPLNSDIAGASVPGSARTVMSDRPDWSSGGRRADPWRGCPPWRPDLIPLCRPRPPEDHRRDLKGAWRCLHRALSVGSRLKDDESMKGRLDDRYRSGHPQAELRARGHRRRHRGDRR